MSFASRVGRYDLTPAEDEDEQLIHRRADDPSLDDIEKEYLMGGGSYVPVDHDTQAPSRNCCNLPGSKAEGQRLILAATIISMVMSGLLLYSGINILSVNKSLAVMCCIIAGVVIVNSIIALFGLCLLTTRGSFAFKFSHWMHMITFWSLLAFLCVQMHYWDGSVKPLKHASSSATTTPSAVKGPAAAFLQLAAPSMTQVKDFFSFMSSPVWFLSLTGVMIGMNIMYVFGSLRIQTKMHARWGAAVVSWLSLLASLTIVGLSVYALVSDSHWRKWQGFVGILTTAVGGALTVALTIVSFWADSQIRVEQVKATNRLNLILYLIIPAVILLSGAYYLYYLTLVNKPLSTLVQVVSFLGISTQMLLFTLVMMLVVWRNNITDEFKSSLGTELYADADAFENEA